MFSVPQNGVQQNGVRMGLNTPRGFQTASFDSKMPYSDYLKHRAIVLCERGLSSQTIVDLLAEEGLKATRQGTAQFLKRYATTCSIKRARGSGRRPKATLAVRTIVEAQMRTDDGTTAEELRKILREKGHALSSTILRCRPSLGWTFRGSSYCQMIREPNKAKRLEWALRYQAEAEAGFLDVVYSDETSIQLETHRRFCCRKSGEPPRNKPRYRNPQSHRKRLAGVEGIFEEGNKTTHQGGAGGRDTEVLGWCYAGEVHAIHRHLRKVISGVISEW